MRTYHLRVFTKTKEVPFLQFQDEAGTVIDERQLDRKDIDEFSKEVDDSYRKVASGLPRLGQMLYEWLDGPAQRWLERIINDPKGLALHITVEEKLRHLPWELIAAPGRSYLGVNPLSPFTPVRRVSDNVVTHSCPN